MDGDGLEERGEGRGEGSLSRVPMIKARFDHHLREHPPLIRPSGTFLAPQSRRHPWRLPACSPKGRRISSRSTTLTDSRSTRD